MQGIKRGKIFSRERVDLSEVIPLKVPFSIQIDVCSACNMKCDFCFHSDLESIKRNKVEFGMMSYETFTKVIDNIKKTSESKIKKLKLFKIGEPLLNTELPKMIQYVKESDIAEIIEITSNGTLLTPKLTDQLIEAGLNILNISVNAIDEMEYKRKIPKGTFEEYVNNIDYFYKNKGQCILTLKYSNNDAGKNEKDKFYNIFQDKCDELFVEDLLPSLWQDTNISEKVKDLQTGLYGQKRDNKLVCPFLFTTLVINHKGIAHLCCVDWKSEYLLGDMTKETLKDVWEGNRLRSYQIIHLNKEKENIEICRNCESLNSSTTDNIDKDAERILKKIRN